MIADKAEKDRAAAPVSVAPVRPWVVEFVTNSVDGASRIAQSLAEMAFVRRMASVARKKSSYFRAKFARLKARREPKKAVVAVAASMLTAAYFMLRGWARRT